MLYTTREIGELNERYIYTYICIPGTTKRKACVHHCYYYHHHHRYNTQNDRRQTDMILRIIQLALSLLRMTFRARGYSTRQSVNRRSNNIRNSYCRDYGGVNQEQRARRQLDTLSTNLFTYQVYTVLRILYHKIHTHHSILAILLYRHANTTNNNNNKNNRRWLVK